MEMLFLSLSKLLCARGVARQMGINVTDLFLLACLCDVLSVPLLNQVYRLGAENLQGALQKSPCKRIYRGVDAQYPCKRACRLDLQGD